MDINELKAKLSGLIEKAETPIPHDDKGYYAKYEEKRAARKELAALASPANIRMLLDEMERLKRQAEETEQYFAGSKVVGFDSAPDGQVWICYIPMRGVRESIVAANERLQKVLRPAAQEGESK